MAASLAIGAAFALAMLVATWRAAVILPAAARVPLHAGMPEHSYWMPKRAGLAFWLGAGAVIYAGFGSLCSSGIAADWASSVRLTLTPAAMCVACAFQAAALISALRRAAAADEPEPAAACAGPRLPSATALGYSGYPMRKLSLLS